MHKDNLKLSDRLAIERTHLANERTFLAYFRTTVIFLASGFGFYKLQILQEIKTVGVWLMVLSPLLVIFGYMRFIICRRRIKKLYEHQ